MLWPLHSAQPPAWYARPTGPQTVAFITALLVSNALLLLAATDLFTHRPTLAPAMLVLSGTSSAIGLVLRYYAAR